MRFVSFLWQNRFIFLTNGINVRLREIEEVLYQFLGVKEAAVVGGPDGAKENNRWL